MALRLRSASLFAALLAILAALVHTSTAPTPARAETLPRVKVVAPPGTSLLVHGTYPKTDSPCVRPVQPVLHARYSGTVEVGKDTDGKLFVIGELPFEEYLKGIAEVPRTWPMAVLRAQVVAARSYALAHLAYGDATGDRLGYQLCVTDACQVYRGVGVSGGPYGDRWARAVERTKGEVLLHAGRPADTLYSSTSPGYTIGNEKVFGSQPLPYLRPVDEEDDGASPVSRWQVRLPFSDVRRFLQRAGLWGDQPVNSVKISGGKVVVMGGGATEEMTKADFRSYMNSWAHCLEPDAYPSIDTDGSLLPQTVPSRWFDLSSEGGAAVLDGRGWGHGVGMVQWGAYGKANRGWTYQEILSFYYGGLKPRQYETPATIRVGIAVGLTSVRISATGDAIVIWRDADRPAPWRITGGRRLRVRHSGPLPKYISPGRITASPDDGRVGQGVVTGVSVPSLAVVHLALRDGDEDVEVTSPVTLEPGEHDIRWTPPDVPDGTYELQAVFTNGIDIVRSGGRQMRLRGGTSLPSPTPSDTTPPATTPPAALPAAASGSSPVLPITIGATLAALAGVGLYMFLRRRRRPPATIPGDGSGV